MSVFDRQYLIGLDPSSATEKIYDTGLGIVFFRHMAVLCCGT